MPEMTEIKNCRFFSLEMPCDYCAMLNMNSNYGCLINVYKRNLKDICLFKLTAISDYVNNMLKTFPSESIYLKKAIEIYHPEYLNLFNTISLLR